MPPCNDTLGMADLLERACRAQKQQQPVCNYLQLRSVGRLSHEVEMQMKWCGEQEVCMCRVKVDAPRLMQGTCH